MLVLTEESGKASGTEHSSSEIQSSPGEGASLVVFGAERPRCMVKGRTRSLAASLWHARSDTACRRSLFHDTGALERVRHLGLQGWFSHQAWGGRLKKVALRPFGLSVCSSTMYVHLALAKARGGMDGREQRCWLKKEGGREQVPGTLRIPRSKWAACGSF